MIIEMFGRFLREFSSEENKEIKETLDIMRNIDSQMDYDYEKEKLIDEMNPYEYIPMSVDSSEIWGFNYVDEDNFSVRFINGSILTFRGSYDSFKRFFGEINGKKVITFE